MGKLVLVGGPSASGKSTFVKGLNNKYEDSLAYRRVQAFFDIAELKNIPDDQVFKKVLSRDADNWFIEVCKKHVFVISDVHYALQMSRTFKTDNTGANIYQEYVPTISPYLIANLLKSDIDIIAAYLHCPPEVLYERAIRRNKEGQRELRATSIEDVVLQSAAERNEWQNVAKNKDIRSIELNTHLYSNDELVKQFSDFMSKKDSSKKTTR